MGRRRLGRETAFKALYRVDVTGKGMEEALAGLDPENGDEEAVRFAQELLETVGAHATHLDEILNGAVDRWGTDRMAVVDRSLLRLGAAEILYWRWIPDEVSIDEYVDLAKKFGSDEAGGFVNAVLDRISKEARAAGADS
ncbi:MAG: N utilization substance protein B [Gemmatimonadota bacterium]|nr:MAG: N utilization substance protein B [Gemmatimonadota bacterium]